MKVFFFFGKIDKCLKSREFEQKPAQEYFLVTNNKYELVKKTASQ